MTIAKLFGASALVAITAVGMAFLPHGKEKTDQIPYSKIDTVGLTEYGVNIVDPGQPEFNSILRKQRVASAPPFSVFVVNNADQGIASCTLKWVILLSDGQIATHYFTKSGTLELAPDATPARLREGIPARGTLLFSPMTSSDPDDRAGAGTGFRTGGGNPEISVQLFKSTWITVSVDGVLFCDGTYAGPDVNNDFELFRGQIEANRDLASEIDTMIGAGKKIEAVVRRLEKVANIQSNEVQPSAGEAPKYSLGRWMKRASYAHLLLAIREKKGEDAMLERVRAELNKPRIELRKLEPNQK
jgi:hypothetical protein